MSTRDPSRSGSRPRRKPTAAGIAAIANPAGMIKHILVPVDFSPASLAGLQYAVELGKSLHARLTILFVVEPLYSAGDMGLLLEEGQRRGREELSRLEQQLKKRGTECRAMVQIGPPYQVIGDAAVRQHADLIVMATHGRTGLSHLVMGSVAERVVRTARCPVLTVRPPGRTRVRRRVR